MKPRKRSISITLVLATATAGCTLEEQKTAVRDVYDSPTECHADWGDEDAKCEVVLEPATANTAGAVNTGNGYYRMRYYGPSYWHGSRPAYRMNQSGQQVSVGNRATSSRSSHTSSSSRGSNSSSTSRGGFGGASASRGASS